MLFQGKARLLLTIFLAGTLSSALTQALYPTDGLSLVLQKENQEIIQGGVVYGGERVQGMIRFDSIKWSNQPMYYAYVFIANSEGELQLLYPNTWDEQIRFPQRDGENGFFQYTKIFSGRIEPPFGKENFFLLLTQNPLKIGDLMNNQSRGGNRGVFNLEELMKLVKGSKLSGLFDPSVGRFAVSTLQFESRPAAERTGIQKEVTRKTEFILPDSSEIFTTPTPQNQIIRDSFPTIEIIDPALTGETRGLQITNMHVINIRGIAVHWRNNSNSIRSITINGKPVSTFRPATGYFDCPYEPTNGHNILYVRVESNQGFSRTIRIKFNFQESSKEIKAPGKDHLLVIGINRYNHWPTLNNAAKDANDFFELMTNEYQFSRENSIELLDERATRKDIFAYLREYAKLLNENDRLLVYFAGHGYYDTVLQMGYWIPVDAASNADDEYISNLEITRIFHKIKAKNIFVIADACYSGQLLRDMQQERSNDYKSRLMLCSGKLKPVPDGTPGSNSPFATKLLSYLRNPIKEEVLASDLIYNIKLAFSQSNGQKPVGGAIDEVGDENGDFVLKYAKKR
jgi:hypothetical protein